MILLSAWLATAFATDFVRSSVGASAVYVPQVPAGDVDLLLGERFRLTVVDGDDFDVRALADARFTIDPNDVPTLEYHRVSQLGATLEGNAWSVDLGRHPVRYGGPRLVDGAQVLYQPGDAEIGAWFGVAPDLFTTLPRLRPGGGPIVAWNRSQVGGSVVGELLVDEAGELDRAAVLANARASHDRLLDVLGRVDFEVAGPAEPHLSDGQVLVLFRPWNTTRFDVLYNAFSSLRYQRTEGLDPTLQRFEQRLLELGLELGILQDALDPSINHLVGGGAKWRSPAADLAPFFGVTSRYRHNINPLNRYTRVTPHAGVGMEASGWLELTVDANYLDVDRGRRGDMGFAAFWEPADALIGLDGSVRALVNPGDYDGIAGFYTDLYVDWWLAGGWSFIVGSSVLSEPAGGFMDTSLAGYVRVTHRARLK